MYYLIVLCIVYLFHVLFDCFMYCLFVLCIVWLFYYCFFVLCIIWLFYELFDCPMYSLIVLCIVCLLYVLFACSMYCSFALCLVLCHSVHSLCVNMCCTTATGWQPNCSFYKYIISYNTIHHSQTASAPAPGLPVANTNKTNQTDTVSGRAAVTGVT